MVVATVRQLHACIDLCGALRGVQIVDQRAGVGPPQVVILRAQVLLDGSLRARFTGVIEGVRQLECRTRRNVFEVPPYALGVEAARRDAAIGVWAYDAERWRQWADWWPRGFLRCGQRC